MLVVGGTYTEVCQNPGRKSLAGSGLRAAAALASAGDVVLHTAVADAETQILRLTAGALDIEPQYKIRSEPVSFSYFTPLAAPTINGQAATLTDGPIDAGSDHDAALVFGMLEARDQVRLRARRAVLDPQKPRDLDRQDVPPVEADELVLVLNGAETRQLGDDHDLLAAARNLLRRYSAAAVVTKRGPRGAVVTTVDAQHLVEPYETSHVYPVGSGDVFAAGFAHAWAAGGADPVEAAHAGSAAAAAWCETEDYEGLLDGPGRRRKVPLHDDATVYLAGPFFTLAERYLVDVVKAALAPQVWSPLHEVGVGGPEVAEKDLEGLRSCDAVLALADGTDAGTLFEVGYATLAGIPIVAYGERADDEAYKMLVGTGAEVVADLSTAVYRAVWAAMRHRTQRAG